MRLIMVGTGPFAVPTFRELYKTRHEVVLLVTAPLRTHRGKQIAPVSRIREIAAEHDTPIFDPENINASESRDRLAAFEADLLVVCDYGQILSAETLATARLGGVNLHGALLPKYRGAAPVNWAVYHGQRETGVTVIHMTPKVDAGPAIAQASLAIEPEETAPELEDRLAELGAPLVCRTIDVLESGTVEPVPQDPALASRAPRLKKTHGVVDWSRPARAICSQIRAFQPWPGSYTFWHRADGPAVRLILWEATPTEAADAEATPGTVLEAADGRLVVAAGEGAVRVRRVQPAGKREMDTRQFLRGYRVTLGDRFGPG